MKMKRGSNTEPLFLVFSSQRVKQKVYIADRIRLRADKPRRQQP